MGKTQAQIAAKSLRGKQIEVVLSSDLVRAKQTAEIISKEIETTVLYDWMLRERNFGDVENKPSAEVDWDEVFSNGDDNWPFGIESQTSLRKRTKMFLCSLNLLSSKYKTIAIVTHGGILNAIGWLQDHNYEFRHYENCEIVEYDYDNLLKKL